MRKLMYRVVFPFELKLRNTTYDCPEADHEFALFGVVVHVGSGPNHGEHVMAHLYGTLALVKAAAFPVMVLPGLVCQSLEICYNFPMSQATSPFHAPHLSQAILCTLMLGLHLTTSLTFAFESRQPSGACICRTGMLFYDGQLTVSQVSTGNDCLCCRPLCQLHQESWQLVVL